MPKSRFISALACCAVLLGAGSAFAQEVTITEKARAHFEAGVNLLQDPDGAQYEEAYREFKTAYAESPSWKILGNLGIAAMKLERDGEAIDAFKRYLSEGGSSMEPDERAQVERDLKTLEAGVVRVTLSSVPAGAIITDERIPVSARTVVNRYGPLQAAATIGIRAGHHRITASADGHQNAVWELEIQPGATLEHVFELPAAEAGAATGPGSTAPAGGAASTGDQPKRTPAGVYVGLAATGVFTVGAAVTGVLALGKHSDFEDANKGADPAAAEDLRSSGQTLNLVTDILIGAAVVSAGVTAVLYFTSKPGSSEAGADAKLRGPRDRAQAGFSLRPVLLYGDQTAAGASKSEGTINGGLLTATGSF
jgi:hypothetical protein